MSTIVVACSGRWLCPPLLWQLVAGGCVHHGCGSWWQVAVFTMVVAAGSRWLSILVVAAGGGGWPAEAGVNHSWLKGTK